jgi:hypothetical protein
VTRLVGDSALSVLCLLSESPCRSKSEDGTKQAAHPPMQVTTITVPLVRVGIEPREWLKLPPAGKEGPFKHGPRFDALRALRTARMEWPLSDRTG